MEESSNSEHEENEIIIEDQKYESNIHDTYVQNWISPIDLQLDQYQEYRVKDDQYLMTPCFTNSPHTPSIEVDKDSYEMGSRK